jgi:hypothetical protein
VRGTKKEIFDNLFLKGVKIPKGQRIKLEEFVLLEIGSSP